MTFEQWLQNVPEAIAKDPVWRLEAYRIALFLDDLAWSDATKLMTDRRTIGSADQLYRAVGSIGANLCEGYCRGSGKDRARFYEYALGSAREARGWYYGRRHVLGDTVSDHRIDLCRQVIQLTLCMVPDQRMAKGIESTRRPPHESRSTDQI